MKILWGRFGAEITMTDEEYSAFIQSCKKGDGITSANIIEKCFKENRFNLDGETYFPEKTDIGLLYDNPDEELTCDI